MDCFHYAVTLIPAEEGGFVVTCRDLPELITQGDDREHALSEAADALDETLAAYMARNQRVPDPSPTQTGEVVVAPAADTSAKAALHLAMHDAGISKVELAARMGVDEKEVRRLLDPHYGSKLPRIAQAVQALGRRLVIGLAAL